MVCAALATGFSLRPAAPLLNPEESEASYAFATSSAFVAARVPVGCAISEAIAL